MKSPASLTLWLLSLRLASVLAQQSFVNNVTAISGTWSSGSGNVMTGSGFCNPLQFSFTYPKTTGVSWSFTDDGFFEQAEYQMQSNGSSPNCIEGTVLFQHGTYEFMSNGSIVATPFAVDGRLQVQAPCAAQSNVIMQFNVTVLMQGWSIVQDDRGYKLQLYKYDGSLYTPMYQKANPPNMLPTETLTTNLTIGPDGQLTSTNEAAMAMRTLQKGSLIVLVTLLGVVAGVSSLFTSMA